MLDQMKKLMEMKRQADQIKRELERAEIVLDDPQGVRVVVNGAQQLQSVTIRPDLLAAGETAKAKTEGLIVKVVNQAITKSQAQAAEKMKNLMGINLPGF